MADQMSARDDGQVVASDGSGVVKDGAHKVGNMVSTCRVNNVEGIEEGGVYFDDGLRKIDLILAYEGNKK